MKDIFYKLPKEFLQRLIEIYPQNYNNILNTFLSKKLTTFRINYLKTDLANLKETLKKENLSYKELQFPKGAFVLKDGLSKLQTTSVYNNGLIYVQNVSSMLPVILLEPKDGEKILDLCASPGAKTTQLASLAKNSEIIAIEKIRIRYYKLLTNLKIQGTTNVKPYLLDGIFVRKKFPEYFDKILLDTPCSAEARFLLHDPHTYKYWRIEKIYEMSHKQKKLIQSAFFALKEGGILVYSTCTFSPEENEEVIDWFINKFKDKLEVLPIELNLSNVMSGLTYWEGKKFSKECSLTKRIIPNDFMEGFFVAKIRKISS